MFPLVSHRFSLLLSVSPSSYVFPYRCLYSPLSQLQYSLGLGSFAVALHRCVAAVAGGGGDAVRNKRKRGETEGGERRRNQGEQAGDAGLLQWKRLPVLPSGAPRKTAINTLCSF